MKVIAWDGEGISLDGPERPQHYVVFGSSSSAPTVGREHLGTIECLEHILRVGKLYPKAVHVAFAFGYDVNMILRGLPKRVLQRVHQNGRVTITKDDTTYFIEHMRGKWFTVSSKGVRVTIYDLFSYFGCSFIKAYKMITGKEVSEVVVSGKENRGSVSIEDLQEIAAYWKEEIQALQELGQTFLGILSAAGFPCMKPYGPGSLATHLNKTNNIVNAMGETPDVVNEAAQYAYSGGRFELLQVGRYVGDVWGADINSAYPYAISKLPDMSPNAGEWEHVIEPTEIEEFGVYRYSLRAHPLSHYPGPIPHRSRGGAMAFPWISNGWAWSPEAQHLLQMEGAVIHEGFVWREATAHRPYAFITDMYELRKQWKAEGKGEQLALKLGMNSLYGKMAQRVGWDTKRMRSPRWHQLEWAGWVTSFCRAQIYSLLLQVDPENILAVETDGVYLLEEPPVSNSSDLGGWEVSSYDEIQYLQSGLAWLRKGDDWTCKRRGLTAASFPLDASVSKLKSMRPHEIWEPLIASRNVFMGMGVSLATDVAVHGSWQDKPREIGIGSVGKRVHIPPLCPACKDGKTGYEALHRMVVNPPADKDSYPHKLPWKDGDYTPPKWDQLELEI